MKTSTTNVFLSNQTQILKNLRGNQIKHQNQNHINKSKIIVYQFRLPNWIKSINFSNNYYPKTNKLILLMRITKIKEIIIIWY